MHFFLIKKKKRQTICSNQAYPLDYYWKFLSLEFILCFPFHPFSLNSTTIPLKINALQNFLFFKYGQALWPFFRSLVMCVLTERKIKHKWEGRLRIAECLQGFSVNSLFAVTPPQLAILSSAHKLQGSKEVSQKFLIPKCTKKLHVLKAMDRDEIREHYTEKIHIIYFSSLLQKDFWRQSWIFEYLDDPDDNPKSKGKSTE